MGKDKRTHFWASYADLMTSLFFVMLTLFIVVIIALNKIIEEAVSHGGDPGGPYYCYPEELKKAIGNDIENARKI